MALSLVLAPTVEPVTLADVKLHLRVDGTSEDVLIAALVAAARQHVESFTHRALCTQTWDLKLDDFPSLWSTEAYDRRQVDAGAVWFPLAPLQSVTSVSYVDTAGATQTWGASNYTVDAPSGPYAARGRLVPAYSIYYPVTRAVPNAVTVRFVCGYGAASSVPDAINAAIKILVAHWYTAREPILMDRRMEVLPMSVDALLWPYKAF